MANEGYDKDADGRNNPVSGGSPADGRGALRDAEQDGLYNSSGDSQPGAESASPGDETDRLGKGFTDSGGDGRTRATRLKGFLSRRKRALLLMSAPAIGIIVLLIFLLIIASSLKLPDIMQNIEGYEFAQVTRQFSQAAQRTSDETLALEATDDSTFSGLKARFTSGYTDIRNSTWGRMDAYRPSQVIKTIAREHDLTLRYKASAIPGRQIFKGASIDGVEYDVQQLSGVSRWTPGLRQIVSARNRVAFARDFYPALDKAMRTSEVSFLVRDPTSLSILQQTNGSRIGWVLSKFQDKSSSDAVAEETTQTFDATEAGDTATDSAKTAEIASADQDVKAAEQDAVSDPTKLKAAIANNGDVPAAQAAADAQLKSSLTQDVLNNINPIYGIATPICIIYDGSVINSGPAIQNQSNQQQNAFNDLAAKADQQKTGDTTASDSGELAYAVGATNAQIGDTSQSIPYDRSSGNTIDTSTIPSAEAGAGGSYDYSVFDALGISSSSFTGKILNGIANTGCPALTNTAVAGGLGVLNIVAGIFSLGGSDVAETTAGNSARAVVTQFTRNVADNIVKSFAKKIIVKDGVQQVESTALSRGTRFAFKQGVIIGSTYGATELAHMIVAARSGAANNGLAQNTDLVNEADSGANIQAGELERQQLFGRPLDKNDALQADVTSQQYVNAQNSAKSFTDRYFATSNADSLVSHMALDLSESFSTNIINSITKLGAAILRPMSYIGSLLSLSGVAHATPASSTQHYGNVQFGWTNDEEHLINSDSSYKPLENQHILDGSHVETQIAQKYAVCFGYTYDSTGNGDLDPTDSSGDMKSSSDGSVANLLSTGDIQRDKDGNVVDSGLCSPSNLSYDNTGDPLAANPWSTNGKPHDMIFRWRLAMSYDTTLDQQINEQSVTPTPGAGS